MDLHYIWLTVALIYFNFIGVFGFFFSSASNGIFGFSCGILLPGCLRYSQSFQLLKINILFDGRLFLLAHQVVKRWSSQYSSQVRWKIWHILFYCSFEKKILWKILLHLLLFRNKAVLKIKVWIDVKSRVKREMLHSKCFVILMCFQC